MNLIEMQQVVCVDACEDAWKAIEDVLDDANVKGVARLSVRLSVITALMMETAQTTHDEIGAPPRETLLELLKASLCGFPEEEKKPEDIPKAKRVKPGPSPWGL